jgi:hypothetical protein
MRNLKFTTKPAIAAMCLLAAVLAGCGTDANKSLEIVKKTFPNSKVYQFPDKNYTFILVDSTGVKKVTCLNLTDDNIDGVVSAVEK